MTNDIIAAAEARRQRVLMLCWRLSLLLERSDIGDRGLLAEAIDELRQLVGLYE
jgi:hypothetical protein